MSKALEFAVFDINAIDKAIFDSTVLRLLDSDDALCGARSSKISRYFDESPFDILLATTSFIPSEVGGKLKLYAATLDSSRRGRNSMLITLWANIQRQANKT